jgi:hypothetical protein
MAAGFLDAAVLFQYPRFSGRHWQSIFRRYHFWNCMCRYHLVDQAQRSISGPAIFLFAPAWWIYRAASQYVSALSHPQNVIGEYSDLFPLAEELERKILFQDPLRYSPD